MITIDEWISHIKIHGSCIKNDGNDCIRCVECPFAVDDVSGGNGECTDLTRVGHITQGCCDILYAKYYLKQKLNLI